MHQDGGFEPSGIRPRVHASTRSDAFDRSVAMRILSNIFPLLPFRPLDANFLPFRQDFVLGEETGRPTNRRSPESGAYFPDEGRQLRAVSFENCRLKISEKVFTGIRSWTSELRPASFMAASAAGDHGAPTWQMLRRRSGQRTGPRTAIRKVAATDTWGPSRSEWRSSPVLRSSTSGDSPSPMNRFARAAAIWHGQGRTVSDWIEAPTHDRWRIGDHPGHPRETGQASRKFLDGPLRRQRDQDGIGPEAGPNIRQHSGDVRRMHGQKDDVLAGSLRIVVPHGPHVGTGVRQTRQRARVQITGDDLGRHLVGHSEPPSIMRANFPPPMKPILLSNIATPRD